MGSSDPFLRPKGWTVTSWTPRNSTAGLFPIGNLVLIGIDPKDPSRSDLAWLDESLRLRTATNKPERDNKGYMVTMTPESTSGTIKVEVSDFGTGNVGTFTAEADTSGEEGGGPHRRPKRTAV